MKSIHRTGVIALAGVALAVSSCSTGGRSPSGFLGNYQQLNAGDVSAEEAVSAYVNPDVDSKSYHSVVIDPVTTVVATPGIPQEVGSQLAAYLGESLRSQSGARLNLVGLPGPGTLRVRAALTDVIAGQQTGKPVTTVHTNPQATLTGKLGSAELAAFISNVSFEGEILDSVSGERLCAMRTQRLGAKREATDATSWAGVRSGVNQGALRLWKRFSDARGE